MVILPPDITTSVTVFEELVCDSENNQVNEKKRDPISLLSRLKFNTVLLDDQDESSVKKRKLTSDACLQFEEAMQKVHQHLDNMQRIAEEDQPVETGTSETLNKEVLDRLLQAGHSLISELHHGQFHIYNSNSFHRRKGKNVRPSLNVRRRGGASSQPDFWPTTVLS